MPHRTVLLRTLALFLSCQPVFWMGNVAHAQSVLEGSSREREGDTSPRSGAVPDEIFDTSSLVPPATPGLSSDLSSGGAFAAGLAPSGLRPPPLDAPLDPDAYVCSHGDVLELNFWGVQSIRHRLIVDMEGRVFVPRIGHFLVRGRTLTEVRRTLREAARRNYPRLEFDVTLAEPRTFLVQVVDAVGRPGSYPAHATDRVATLIDRAGGYGRNASRRRVEIRRRDGKVLSADLAAFALTGDTAQNPFLFDGDVVRVPFEELAVWIGGAVNRPGRYELVRSRDLAELVELAGGLAPTATHRLPVSVVRRSPDDRQERLLLDFGPDGALPKIELRHEESVGVPSYVELQRSVMVSGAVAGVPGPEDPTATRRHPFIEGDSVRTLLERIGGVGPAADLSRAYLVRKGESLPVDLYALLALRNLEADRPLELGDTLVVPFARRSIKVQGAVFAPGLYAHDPSFGIDQYVALAGGPNKFAQSSSHFRLVGPNGEIREYDRDLAVVPGSSVVVPDRAFSRSEVVQLVISAASVVISGVAVVMAARR